VLLTQMHRDLQRVTKWYKPADFVSTILAGLDETLIRELGGEMTELLAHRDLFQMDDRTLEVCRRWDAFCHDFFHAYQDLALQEVEKV
jgi:hypothetical protein